MGRGLTREELERVLRRLPWRHQRMNRRRSRRSYVVEILFTMALVGGI
jgi:hypothetical protein